MKEKGTILREDLARAVKEYKLSQASIAKAIGMSPATISQYLDGKYPGDTAKMDRLISGYLLRIEEEQALNRFSMPTVRTTVLKNVFEVLRFCHISRKMGIAYGDAGIGKTTAEKEYVEECPETIIIEAAPTYTERDMLRNLHSKLIGEANGSVNQMLDACAARLEGSGRLIIVDEAENLPFKALNTLRRIHDFAKIGIALIGMPRLRSNLVGDKRNFAQLYSRISISKNLSLLQPEDVEEIIRLTMPDQNDLWSVFYNECKGVARNLANIIEQSGRLCDINKIDLSAKVIKQAAQRLII